LNRPHGLSWRGSAPFRADEPAIEGLRRKAEVSKAVNPEDRSKNHQAGALPATQFDSGESAAQAVQSLDVPKQAGAERRAVPVVVVGRNS
jgi:hypothetical protein